MPPELDAHAGHLSVVAGAFRKGRLVPFLGAGVNRCGRPPGTPWRLGEYPPDGGELAAHLARSFAYPLSDTRDLVRISQYVDVTAGAGPLYDELHGIFDADYPPTAVHRLLARLPALLRASGCARSCQLIVTTNYDDVMESALREAGEPFDLVTFMAAGDDFGKFVHTAPDGQRRVIENPNAYDDLACTERSVVLKIHGAVDRTRHRGDSFVITEDNYIDFLAQTNIANLLPVHLRERMQWSHFLFLGYSLRDWNLRVILRRIWGEQRLRYNSWSIQLQPDELDQRFWQGRNVEIRNARLEEYVEALGKQLQTDPEGT